METTQQMRTSKVFNWLKRDGFAPRLISYLSKLKRIIFCIKVISMYLFHEQMTSYLANVL